MKKVGVSQSETKNQATYICTYIHIHIYIYNIYILYTHTYIYLYIYTKQNIFAFCLIILDILYFL